MNLLKKTIEYLFYLFVFLLPWQTRWIWYWGKLNNNHWEYGTFSIYVTEILLLFIILLVIFCGILNLRRGAVSMFPLLKEKKEYTILIIFLLFTIASIFWSNNRYLTFYYWTFFLEGIFIFLLIISQFSFNLPSQIKISKKENRIPKINYVLIWSGGVQAIFSIWQFFSQRVFSSKWLGIAAQLPSNLGVSVIEENGHRWLRTYGSLSHPNILAGFLVIVILVLLTSILNRHDFRSSNPSIKKRLLIIIYYLLFAICLFSLGLTFSRSAWLALIIGLIVLIWQEKKILRSNRCLEKELLTIGLITTIIFIFIFWPLILTRFQMVERLEIKSSQERLSSYRESIALIKTSPLIGIGLGNYTQTVWQKLDSNRPGWAYQPVHNLYLLIWTEIGLIGLILFLFLVIQFLKKANYFLPLVISLLIIGFFDHYLWSLYFGIIFFWLIMGIAKINQNWLKIGAVDNVLDKKN